MNVSTMSRLLVALCGAADMAEAVVQCFCTDQPWRHSHAIGRSQQLAMALFMGCGLYVVVVQFVSSREIK